MASLAHWEEKGSGYFKQQSTRPQTLGYGLTDSPVDQAAWIYEKMWAWSDNQGNPEDALTLDEMLDNIMLYWLPGTATSSARLYWESFAIGTASARLEIPVGVSIYPRETLRPSRRWVDRWMPNLIHYNILERGATSPPGSSRRCTSKKSATASPKCAKRGRAQAQIRASYSPGDRLGRPPHLPPDAICRGDQHKPLALSVTQSMGLRTLRRYND